MPRRALRQQMVRFSSVRFGSHQFYSWTCACSPALARSLSLLMAESSQIFEYWRKAWEDDLGWHQFTERDCRALIGIPFLVAEFIFQRYSHKKFLKYRKTVILVYYFLMNYPIRLETRQWFHLCEKWAGVKIWKSIYYLYLVMDEVLSAFLRIKVLSWLTLE